jgi:hypothetical protein
VGCGGIDDEKSSDADREPLRPLTAALQRHLVDHRLGYPAYAAGLEASAIIERVGGKSAFPGFEAYDALVSQRMKDRGQKSTSNDVFDEFTAFYAPYASVTALDGPTVHRAQMAHLSCVLRLTKSLGDVPALLDKVLPGELEPREAAGW